MAPLRHCLCYPDIRVLPISVSEELAAGWGHGARCEYQADERQEWADLGKEVGDFQQVNDEAQSTSSGQPGSVLYG